MGRFPPWWTDALHAEPERHCVTTEREFDGLPGQRLGLAVEQHIHGEGRLIA